MHVRRPHELLNRRGLDPACGQTDVQIEVDPSRRLRSSSADNDGAVVGLGIDDARATLDHTQLIRDWVRPHVDFDTELTEVDRKQVLLVRVDAGPSRHTGSARSTAGRLLRQTRRDIVSRDSC